MDVGLSWRVSRWVVLVSTILTISFLLGRFLDSWFLFCALAPQDLVNLPRLPSLMISWLVSDEHVTHWLTILAIFILDKLVRDCWSKLETALFFLSVNIFAAAFSLCLLYFINPSSLMPISGNAAVVAAVIVVSTQFDPERLLLGYARVGLKSRHGVFVVLSLFFLFAVFRIVWWSSFLLYVSGFLFSWLYLRFLQHHPQRRYGDHRAGFAFAKFFPGPLEKWVAVPSNLIYYVLLRSKICPGIERHSEIISTASFAGNIPTITSDDERHRRIAIKALNERLFNAQLQPTEPAAWPNLEENEAATTALSSESESQLAVQSVVVNLTAVSSAETV